MASTPPLHFQNLQQVDSGIKVTYHHSAFHINEQSITRWTKCREQNRRSKICENYGPKELCLTPGLSLPSQNVNSTDQATFFHQDSDTMIVVNSSGLQMHMWHGRTHQPLKKQQTSLSLNEATMSSSPQPWKESQLAMLSSPTKENRSRSTRTLPWCSNHGSKNIITALW